MTAKISIMIDGRELQVELGRTILDVCRDLQIPIPTLCHLPGLSEVGACRLCVVELEGAAKLLPACTTPVVANQKIRTRTERLQRYRRMIVELLFSERPHVCAVCVANNRCELQTAGYQTGMAHVRFPYLAPACRVDASHAEFVMDHNRCIMCTRCVRVCDEVEAAHAWDVMGRGIASRIISDFNQPWGESVTCTSCGKCVQVCPTGALWPRNATPGTLTRNASRIAELVARKKWKP